LKTHETEWKARTDCCIKPMARYIARNAREGRACHRPSKKCLLTLARSDDAMSSFEVGDKARQVAWLAQAVHETLAKVLASKPDSPSTITLTAREMEVLRWAGDGKTAAETADILGIAERTVTFHIDNALRRLGAVNKIAGVLKAAMLRLI
jgi:LuxR family quorum-sensing system transcriptional regulator SolR